MILFRKSNEISSKAIKARIFSEKKASKPKEDINSDFIMGSQTNFPLIDFVDKIEAKKFFSTEKQHEQRIEEQKEEQKDKLSYSINSLSDVFEKEKASQFDIVLKSNAYHCQNYNLKKKLYSQGKTKLAKATAKPKDFDSKQMYLKRPYETKINPKIQNTNQVKFKKTGCSLNRSIKKVFESLSEMNGSKQNLLQRKDKEKTNANLSNFLLKNLNSVNNSIYSESNQNESLQNNTILEVGKILRQQKFSDLSQNFERKLTQLRKGSSLTKMSRTSKENSQSIIKDLFHEDISMIVSKTPKYSLNQPNESLSSKRQLLKDFYKLNQNISNKGKDIKSKLKPELKSFSDQMMLSVFGESIQNGKASKQAINAAMKLSENSELISWIFNKNNNLLATDSANGSQKKKINTGIDFRIRTTSQDLKQKLDNFNHIGESFVEVENIPKYRQTLIDLHKQLQKSGNPLAKSDDKMKLDTGSRFIGDKRRPGTAPDNQIISTQTGNQMKEQVLKEEKTHQDR